MLMNRKVFIGRCTEDMTADDLRSYFTKFGEVVDVFIPRPFRAFAFVTFADPETAQNLCGEDHIIKNASVHISSAAPKNFDRGDRYAMGMGGPGGGGYNNGGYGGSQGWGGGGPVGMQGNGRGGMGGGNMRSPNMQAQQMNPNPNNQLAMGLNNLTAAFQMNPAMMAAALSQAAPWNLLNQLSNAAANGQMGPNMQGQVESKPPTTPNQSGGQAPAPPSSSYGYGNQATSAQSYNAWNPPNPAGGDAAQAAQAAAAAWSQGQQGGTWG